MQRSSWWTTLILLVLFFAAWLPRVWALDRFVTADERLWLARSANFYQALGHGDFAATFQREHPGVTVMWAGTLGFLRVLPDYAANAPGQFNWNDEEVEAWLYEHTEYTPLQLLAAGRWWIVLLISLAISAGDLPLRRLLGVPLAMLATLFIAWDPFALALSRQLHPDGLVAVLTALALFLFVTWLYGGRQRRYLVTSGVVMGLAWLTKTPAIFLVPTCAVLIALEWWRTQRKGAGRPGRGPSTSSGTGADERGRTTPQHPITPSPHLLSPPDPIRLLLAFVLWGTIATLTFVALWPAMWVDPLGTLVRMGSEMGEYVQGHVNPNFFWGATTPDPGALFYPVAYWFRITPATVIGLLAATLLGWRRSWPFGQHKTRRTTGALLIFTLIFAAAMTLGSKKFDRYLLPIFPALDIVAALGWGGLAMWMFGKLGAGEQGNNLSTSSGAEWQGHRGEPQTSSVTPRHPITPSPHHPINPAPLLPHLPLSIAFAATLLLHGLLGLRHFPYYLTYYNPLAGGQATAEQVLMIGWGEGLDQAAAWLNQQPDGATVRVVAWYGDGPLSYFLHNHAPTLSFWGTDYWLIADYAVVYISQWQRQIPSQAVSDFFADRTPIHVVQIDGRDMVRIYDLHDVTPPDFTGLATESAGALSDDVHLLAYSLGQHNFLSGDHFLLRLYLQRTADSTLPIATTVRLLDSAGDEFWRSQHDFAQNWRPTDVVNHDYEIAVPADAPSGDYSLAVQTNDREHVVTTVQIAAAQQVVPDADRGLVQISAVEHPPLVKAGKSFLVQMAATGQVDGSLKLSARLVDNSGATIAQTDAILKTDTQVELTPPNETKAGLYTLVAVVYDPQTLNPYPDTQGRFETPLSQVEVGE